MRRRRLLNQTKHSDYSLYIAGNGCLYISLKTKISVYFVSNRVHVFIVVYPDPTLSGLKIEIIKHLSL